VRPSHYGSDDATLREHSTVSCGYEIETGTIGRCL
jgi:hypothetical protein